MRYFFSHLIEIESITRELDKLDLRREQKMHLVALVDSSLYHAILDAILSELSSEDKKIFLAHLKAENNDKIWKLINNKIDKIEDKIKKAAKDLTEELQKDLKEARLK